MVGEKKDKGDPKPEGLPPGVSNRNMMEMKVQVAKTWHAALEGGSIGSTIGGSRAAWLEYHVPASATKEGMEHERAYYEALGRFVQLFAEVEKTVAQTLWAYAKTPPEVAKIIFSGSHLELSATHIKQLAAATNAPKTAQDDLKNALQQLGIITGARNDILHYGASDVAEGRATVSNAWKARAEPVVFPIS